MIDNSFKADGRPMRRFWLNRLNDETGVSRTGRVLEGIVCQDGQVVIQWRPPLTSIAIYKDWDTFMTVHVHCHPSCNEVIFIDGDVKCSRCDGAGYYSGKICPVCDGAGWVFSDETSRRIAP